jgi:thioredoxin-like negative regulator of GroEL
MAEKQTDPIEQALDRLHWSHTHIVMTPASRQLWQHTEAAARERLADVKKELNRAWAHAHHSQAVACRLCHWYGHKSTCAGCDLPHDPDATPKLACERLQEQGAIGFRTARKVAP